MLKAKYFFLTLLLPVFFLSACNKDEEPAPKPQSYLEYSGNVYELKTGVYSENRVDFDGNPYFSLILYTPTMAELQAMQNSENGAGFNGSLLSLEIPAEGGVLQEGAYVFSGAGSGNEEFTISYTEIYIEVDSETGGGIIIFPVSGNVNVEQLEVGYMVSFDFQLSNGETLSGRYQGELVNM